MKKYILLGATLLILSVSCTAPIQKDYSHKVDSVLSLMTLEEKIGQMNQYSNDKWNTGPAIPNPNYAEDIKNGKVGSVFNVISVSRAKQYQDMALQSRLKIPLIFGLDVIHGMYTIFPIPLAEAASFDLELIRKTASIAAEEASARGIHWTFAPVVDISRDARWGRVMEGAGEDTWYGTQVGIARIRGFQGNDYESKKTVMACAKHFAAYGAAIAGKDYAGADISENTLFQTYLPPFQAAVEANVATFMNAFNDINGIPATAHEQLQRDILKNKWGFEGFVVSDWGSVAEIVKHRIAKDNKDAARIAATAGCDMDMQSMSYIKNLQALVEEGQVDIAIIDEAVKRILTKKFELGLFDDPYCYNNREHELEDENILSGYRKVAREIGSKSIVLLKNNNVLPISSETHRIALIGPLNKSKRDMIGNWSAIGNIDEVITVYDGLRETMPNSKITYIEGYNLETNELTTLPNLSDFDMVIVAVGERAMESGEAKSKVNINVHKNHQLLTKQIKQRFNKPVISLIMGGRPLIFSDMEPFADAILFTWWLGTEAGNSIADLLTGNYNPSGKLPVTFPRHVGQCPIYYNQKSTGRPWTPNNQYVSGYIDESVKPAYPFGYGLSYTEFDISPPILDKEQYTFNESVAIKAIIKNTGSRKGVETVQLYLQDVVSSMTRPTLELCGIQQVELNPGEEKEVLFTLTAKDLGFFDKNNEFITEPGEFELFVGNSSDNLKKVGFELVER